MATAIPGASTFPGTTPAVPGKHVSASDVVTIPSVVVSDSSKTSNSLLVDNSSLYDTPIYDSYTSDIFSNTESFDALLSVLNNQEISQSGKIYDYVTTISPKIPKTDYVKYSQVIYVDDEDTVYDSNSIFTIDNKSAIIAYGIDKDTHSLLDPNSYTLFKLNKQIDVHDSFVYLTYAFGTPYMTYTEYFGAVRQIDDFYLGDRIPKYSDLVLEQTDIIEDSITFDEKEAIYINDGENEWWVTLFAYNFEATTLTYNTNIFKTRQDFIDTKNEIQKIIDTYTWSESSNSIISWDKTKSTYNVSAFTYYIPRKVRYDVNDAISGQYYSNSPISTQIIESTYSVNISKQNYTFYQNKEQKTFLSLDINFIKDNSIENKISIGRFLDEESFYTFNKSSNTNFTVLDNFSSVTNSILVKTPLKLGNSTFNVVLSTSYLYVDNSNNMYYSYTSNILNDSHCLERFIHVRLSEQTNKSIIDVTIPLHKNVKTNTTGNISDKKLLYTYETSVFNQIEFNDEVISYYDYITYYHNIPNSLKGQKFSIIDSYDYHYAWNIGKDTKVTYVTDRVFPKNILSSIYSFYNPYTKTLEQYKGNVFNFYGYNYGVYPEITSASEIKPVYKRQTFSDNNPEHFIELDKPTNINTYLTTPLVLSNEYDLHFDGKYEYVQPSYTYIVKQDYDNAKKTYFYNVVESINNDGYWKRNFTKEVKPLINISYTYISQPYELSKNNVTPYIKNEILGWQNLYHISYNKFESQNVEEYYYSYWGILSYDNKKNAYTYGTKILNTENYELFNSGDNITFYAFEKDSQNKTRFNDFITVTRQMKISTETIVKEDVFQEEGLVPLCAYTEASFGITNRKQVVVTDQIYVPETYVDIMTVDPLTYEEKLVKVKSADAYYAYSYTLEEIPFKTASYIYNQGAVDINKIDELINAISNIKGNTIYYSDGTNGNPNITLADAMREAFTYMKGSEYSYLAAAINNALNKITTSNNDINKTISDKSYLTTVSSYISKLSYTIADLNSSVTSASVINTSNNINANKKMFETLEELMEKQIEAIKGISLNISTSGGGGGLSGSTNPLINNSVITKIGYEDEYESEVTKKKAVLGKNTKNVTQETETSYETISEFIAIEPEVITTQSYMAFNPKYNEFDRIGIHIDRSTEVYKDENGYFYEKTTYSYLNIADILSNLKIRQNIPTRQEFIIDVSKQLFMQSDFIFSYTSPNEYAKKAIYRANALWTELVNGKYIDDPNPNRSSYVEGDPFELNYPQISSSSSSPKISSYASKENLQTHPAGEYRDAIYETNTYSIVDTIEVSESQVTSTFGTKDNLDVVINRLFKLQETANRTSGTSPINDIIQMIDSDAINEPLESKEYIDTAVTMFGSVANFNDVIDRMLRLNTSVQKTTGKSLLNVIYQQIDNSQINQPLKPTSSNEIEAIFGSMNKYNSTIDKFLKLEENVFRSNRVSILQTIYQQIDESGFNMSWYIPFEKSIKSVYGSVDSFIDNTDKLFKLQRELYNDKKVSILQTIYQQIDESGLNMSWFVPYEKNITSIYGSMGNFKNDVNKLLQLNTTGLKNNGVSILETIYQQIDKSGENMSWYTPYKSNITSIFGSVNNFLNDIDKFMKLDKAISKSNGTTILQTIYQQIDESGLNMSWYTPKEKTISSVYGSMSKFNDSIDKLFKLNKDVQRLYKISIIKTIYQQIDESGFNMSWYTPYEQNITSVYGSTGKFNEDINKLFKLNNLDNNIGNQIQFIQSIYQKVDSSPVNITWRK